LTFAIMAGYFILLMLFITKVRRNRILSPDDPQQPPSN
jgi:hypothetical protein